MTTWPTTKATTTYLDQGTDSPRLARPELKQNVDNVNDIIDMFNISSPTNNQILKYSTAAGRFELATDTSTGITLVGDDSTGTLISDGETIKIAGTQNITTAVSGDTLTITGPNLTSYITTSSTNTLTNKSIALSTNTITGTTAQFNTALSDGDFATLAGTETLTNKTLTSPVISTISNTGTVTLPTATDTLVGKATTDTLTNKTINLTSNTLSGTTAQFNTALSDGDFATLAGTETLTNKTLTSPVISQIVSVSNGNITVEPNGTGKAIMGPAFTATNFPYTIYNSSNSIPQWDSASYKGNQMVYSNLSVADITTFDGRYTNNSRTTYVKADSSATTYNNTNWRISNQDQSIFDLNGATFGSTATGTRATSLRGSSAITVLTNSGGGTKTGPNLVGANAFIQVDENHGGTLTVTNAMAVRSNMNVRGNSTDTTTITNGYNFISDTNGGGGSSGVAGTNYKITNAYAFADIPSTVSNLETTHYGYYMASGSGAGTKYFLYTADDTYQSRLGTIERYREKQNALTSSSTITVDADLAPVHTVTLGINTQFGIANLATGETVTLIIRQDATGSRTATFTSDTSTAVKFAGGVSTLSTTASAIDVVSIYNDGTNLLGNIAKAYA